MKFFITGGTGFVGKNLAIRLKSLGHVVYNYYRGMHTDIMRINYPDVIIHCAAECRKSELMFDSNVVLTHNLLKSLRNVDYKLFIYIGSSSEYGAVDGASSESMAINPRNTYEATKGAGTLLCKAEAEQYKKPVVIIRPYSLYGMHEREDRLMPTLFRNFLGGNVTTIDLESVHDWVYIDDFIDAILKIAFRDVVPRGEIINVGTGIQKTNLDVVNIFNAVVGEAKWIASGKKIRDYDVKSWRCDTWFSKQRYGISCETSLISGIKKYWEHIK